MKPTSTSANVVWHHGSVTRAEREARNGHRGAAVWLTGLSGSGKSTLAHALERRLFDVGCQVCSLDGDNVRHGLCGDLGFSAEHRRENIRRVGEVTKLYVEAGQIVVTAFISPLRDDRERVRGLLPHGDFLEVHVDCPLEVCEARDVKGFYRRARAGEIANYTGITSPYEPPMRPELVLDTAHQSVDECITALWNLLASFDVVRSYQSRNFEAGT